MLVKIFLILVVLSLLILFLSKSAIPTLPRYLYQLPQHVKPTDTGSDQLIPKKMVKILITSDEDLPLVPKYLLNCVQSWINLNPDYELFILDHKGCVKFIKENFPPKVLQSYNSLKPYAYKCDLARICWLYIHGGVYSDFRMEILKPLNEIIEPDTFFCISDDYIIDNGCQNPLINSFIASVPKNPFLGKIIDKICDNVANKYYGKSPLCITGPVVVGETIRSIVGGTGKFIPGIYTWNGHKYEILHFTTKYIERNNENIILVKPKKPEFDSDIKTGNIYWKMWSKHDVYTT
jgi:mannosyltransferase OCH1-like enzyme